MTQRQIWAVLGALMLGMLLAALDQTIVATSLPTPIPTYPPLTSMASAPPGDGSSARQTPRKVAQEVSQLSPAHPAGRVKK